MAKSIRELFKIILVQAVKKTSYKYKNGWVKITKLNNLDSR